MSSAPWLKLARLPAADRGLLARSVLVLAASRLALWLLPLRVVRRYLPRIVPRSTDSNRPTAERIAWAIAAARRVVPRATCLPQALAAEALLERNGHPVDLRIGVVKTERGRLVAHAWVESDGQVVVGDLDEGLSGYTPLPPLPPPRAGG